MSKHTPTALRPVAAFALLGLLAACSPKQPETATGEAVSTPTAAQTSSTPAAADATRPAAEASTQVKAMSADDLREAARKALSANRIYAPGGDNAVEYYLALRDKQPDDAATASALTDLMPYTVIAAEQSINRKDFGEAGRLAGLIAKADPAAPALPRLTHAIEAGEKLAAQQEVSDEAKAKAAAEAKAKETQRLAEQAAQQRQAAAALAAQQAQQAEQERQAAAARAAEAQRTAQQKQPATPAPQPAPPPPAPVAAAQAAQELRIVSAPAPRYPPDAFRAGTSGEVVVEITVGPDGSVSNARVVRATPTRVFDREAINAVRRWKFEPIGSTMTTRRTIVFKPG